jgi:hypothetical protein
MEEDDWEAPKRFWQILGTGGFVTNVDDEEKGNIELALDNGKHTITVEDIYGDDVLVVLAHVSMMKLWTERGGIRWKKNRKAAGQDESLFD